MPGGRDHAKAMPALGFTVLLILSCGWVMDGQPDHNAQLAQAQGAERQPGLLRQKLLQQKLRQRIMAQQGRSSAAANANSAATGDASEAGANSSDAMVVTGDTDSGTDLRTPATRATEKEAWLAEMRRQKSRRNAKTSSARCTIAGLEVAVWKPKSNAGPAPLVVFSHGFHGINTQSDYIMRALADAGYIVMAPNHDDAFTKSLRPPEVKFSLASKWNASTYRKRGDDIARLLAAVNADPHWNRQIDKTRIALMGHSLGGYTVLALAGGWPQWKLHSVKAVVALSPYCSPFLAHKTLTNISVPVMYQGGTKDWGITPFLLGKHGAYTNTPSPAVLVELQDANHFTWSGLNDDPVKAQLIDYYCVAFLNKYVKGDASARPEKRLQGVRLIETK